MEEMIESLPACWAPFIINGDDSGLDEDEAAKARTVVENFAHDGFIFVDVDLDSTYHGRCGRLMYECADYTVVER
jgi:hypothetical protein